MLTKYKTPILLFLILITSCKGREYVVTESYIKSNKEMESFFFAEIETDSVNEEGIPIVYNVVRKAIVGSKNGNKKLPKKIFFYLESEKFEWNDISSGVMTNTLSIKMHENGWYLIGGLMGSFGNPDKRVFIHIDKNNKYTFYYTQTVSNW